MAGTYSFLELKKTQKNFVQSTQISKYCDMVFVCFKGGVHKKKNPVATFMDKSKMLSVI